MGALPRSIGRRRAIALAESGWWVGRAARDVAKFQLFTRELCMPFPLFHQALEQSLGRPVWLHEFGFNHAELIQEFLGERDAPELEDIMALIPDKQRMLLELDDAA